MKTLSILGSGWLGYALANSCKETFQVKLSVRTKEKQKQFQNEGFEAFILNEEEYSSLDTLLQCDYLFINFPPSKSKDYLNFLNTIYTHQNINQIKKIFFISSSSVYPKEKGIYKEEDKILNPSSKIVFEAEELIKEKSHVIFRCSGLMGYDRIAGKYFAKKLVKNANENVNYVHRDDVINAFAFAINKDLKGVFNLSCPFHPNKFEVYSLNALKYGFDKPIFEFSDNIARRIIDGSKIEKKGFKYKYENPLEFD